MSWLKEAGECVGMLCCAVGWWVWLWVWLLYGVVVFVAGCYGVSRVYYVILVGLFGLRLCCVLECECVWFACV